MSTTFKPAVRAGVNLLIGVAGASGSGKTYSAMRMAKGIAGDRRFAVIDTERGRASHYAGRFQFDVAELNPPFRPDAYAEAIIAADAAGYPVIVVDSASHEHAGDGGLLDWHEEEVDRLAGGDWKKRDAVNMIAWAKVKTSHKRFVTKLLQLRAHVILCFRAEEKIDIVREGGKTKIIPKQSLTGLAGWIPIAEKTLPFELTASFLLTPDAPGMPKPIKMQEDHKAIFQLDRQLDEEAGRRIAIWAAGDAGTLPQPPAPRPERTERHIQMISAFENTARKHGADAFVEAWKITPPDDRAAIGKNERDRIAAIGSERDLQAQQALEGQE